MSGPSLYCRLFSAGPFYLLIFANQVFLRLLYNFPFLTIAEDVETPERCDSACWMGTEDCCSAIEQPMLTTSSSDRLAYYNPLIDEFERFGEGPLFTMDLDYNYVDYHPSGDMVYFSDPYGERVRMFEAKSGEYGGAVCASIYLPTKQSWYPSVIRFNPYDEWLYVSELDLTGSLFGSGNPVTILKFKDVCLETSDVFFSSVSTSGTQNDQIVDFAFGDSTTMFVMVESKATGAESIYKSSNHYAGPSSFSLLTAPPASSHWTGIEAMKNNQYFLSRRYSYNDVPVTSSVIQYDSDGTKVRDLLPRSVENPLDGWGIRMSPSGLMYVSDYSFHLPHVFDPVTGKTLGTLGASFGMLIFAHHMTFSPGPWTETSNVTVGKTSVKAGDELIVEVKVVDAAGNAYCGLPHLTAVLNGNLFVVDEVNYIKRIWTSSNETRFKNEAGDACHIHTLRMVPEIASLAYKDPLQESNRTDPRLASYLDGKNVTNVHDYDFDLEVYTNDLKYNLLVGTVSFSVTPGKPSSTFTKLSTTILSTISDAEGDDTVKVLSYDDYQNRLMYGGSDYSSLFSFDINGEKYDKENLELDTYGLPKYLLDFVDRGNGEYIIRCKFGPSGVHFVRIMFEDKEIQQALTVVVDHGAVSGAHSVAMGDGLEMLNPKIDGDNVFFVEPKDSRGNFIDVDEGVIDGLNVTVTLNSGRGVSVRKEGDDGRIKVTYNIKKRKQKDDDTIIEAAIGCYFDGQAIHTTASASKHALDGTYKVHQDTRVLDFKVDRGVEIGILTSAGLLVLSNLLFIYLCKRWEKENAIRFSQRKFLYMILVGMLCLYVCDATLAFANSEAVCLLEKFTFHVGLWLILLSLSAKTYRTNAIANNVGLKRVKITDKDLLWKMGLVLLLVVGNLVADTVSSDFELVTKQSDPIINPETGVKTIYSVTQCNDVGGRMSYYQIALGGSELVAMVYLCTQAHYTRKVPSAFAEAKYIALSIYNICVLFLIMSILYAAMDLSSNFPSLYYGMTSLCIFLGVGGSQMLLFVPKFILVVKKKEIKMEDIMSGRSPERQPSGLASGGVSVGNSGVRKFSKTQSSNLRESSAVELSSGSSLSANSSLAANPMQKRNTAPALLQKGSVVGSSYFVGSMASVLEDDESEEHEGDIEGGAKGMATRYDVDTEDTELLKSNLKLAKDLELSLRKDIERQQREIDKMKKLTKKLSNPKLGGIDRKASTSMIVPPKESNWVSQQDDTGKTFFFNKKTNACSYEVPKNNWD